MEDNGAKKKNKQVGIRAPYSVYEAMNVIAMRKNKSANAVWLEAAEMLIAANAEVLARG